MIWVNGRKFNISFGSRTEKVVRTPVSVYLITSGARWTDRARQSRRAGVTLETRRTPQTLPRELGVEMVLHDISYTGGRWEDGLVVTPGAE